MHTPVDSPVEIAQVWEQHSSFCVQPPPDGAQLGAWQVPARQMSSPQQSSLAEQASSASRPQLRVPPQPSGMLPQTLPASSQVVRTQSGMMHEERSKSMKTSAFSWGENS